MALYNLLTTAGILFRKSNASKSLSHDMLAAVSKEKQQHI
jgi:hypothetical protein